MNERLSTLLLGYMPVSKADGSQVLDLRRDALIAAGVTSGRLKHYYQFCNSGRGSVREMSFHVHALMKNADDLDAWPGLPVEGVIFL